MLEVSFNELSLDIPPANNAHSDDIYKQFFSACDKIVEQKIAPLRVVSNVDFKNSMLANVYFTVGQFIEGFEDDQRKRYLGYISQQSNIFKNPYYSFNGKEVDGFAYAHENQVTAISFSSENRWAEHRYEITSETLDPSGTEIIPGTHEINHCWNDASVVHHSNWIRDSYTTKFNTIGHPEDLKKFWEEIETRYPMLVFPPHVEAMFNAYGSVNNPIFKKAVSYLKRLNAHLLQVYMGRANFDDIPGDVSPEGPTTLGMYPGSRDFNMPDGTKKLFSLHAKPGGNLRIHLLPLHGEKKYVVGYVGIHLPTAREN
jgi:hypothetical protein